MRSTRILIAVAIVALAAVTTLYLAMGHKSAGADVATPERMHDSKATRSAQSVALEPVPQVPATEPQPEPATSAVPTPREPVGRSPNIVENENSWAVEYANKQRAELIAEESRLREEFKKDIDAEVEKRFQDGKYRAYAQGTQPTSVSTNGVCVGRGDANTIKYVDIDSVLDAPLFVKQRKAVWLKREIAKRPH